MYHPVEGVQQRGAGQDEDEAQHQRPDDPVHQDRRLQPVWHREVAEDDGEDEQVVHREGALDEIPRQVLAGLGLVVPHQHHAREGQAQHGPDDAPDEGVLHGHLVLAAPEHQQVHRDQHRDERSQREPGPDGNRQPSHPPTKTRPAVAGRCAEGLSHPMFGAGAAGPGGRIDDDTASGILPLRTAAPYHRHGRTTPPNGAFRRPGFETPGVAWTARIPSDASQ